MMCMVFVLHFSYFPGCTVSVTLMHDTQKYCLRISFHHFVLGGKFASVGPSMLIHFIQHQERISKEYSVNFRTANKLISTVFFSKAVYMKVIQVLNPLLMEL